MPRLSTYDYLLLHTHLHQLWENCRQGFGLISTRDQRYLHDFFRLSEKLTEAELMAHRMAVSVQYPSLPQQAGRALKHFADPTALKLQPYGDRRIVVHPILRPQPDIHRLAQALLSTARQIAIDQKDKGFVD